MRGYSVMALLCATARLAAADRLALEPCDQGQTHLMAPAGWTTSVDEGQGVAVFARDPTHGDAPIALLVVRARGSVEDDELVDQMVRTLGSGFQVVSRGRISSGGLQLVAEGKHDGMAMRLGAVVLEHDPQVLVGLLIARPGDYDAAGGSGLAVDLISGWLERNVRKPGPVPKPTPRELRAADLVGRWTTSTGAVYGETAGARVSGGGTSFTFGADGKLEMKSAGISTGSIWRKEDKGTWAIEGGRIVLKTGGKAQRYRLLEILSPDAIKVIDDYFGPDQEVWWAETWVRAK